MKIIQKTETEISEYLTGTVEISEGIMYSEYRLKKRIALFKNRIYPKGKTDSQGRYKYWADIITPRVNSEVKNLRIDTKNFLPFSTAPRQDFGAVFILKAQTYDFMWKTGRAEELNDNVEQFSSDGNILFKKTKNGYDVSDPANTYITNQTAKTVDETAIVERHQLTQSELRAKADLWDNVDDVIENCKGMQFSSQKRTASKATSSPYYEIFERVGETSEADLFEAQGKDGGDEDKYVLARVIFAGLKKGGKKDTKYILFADSFSKSKKMSDIYKSAHRGPYKGKFWREGLYELLLDNQVRANEIANQIARGLEWASKTIFNSPDKLIAQNILTDLQNGDIIKSQGLTQVQVRMQGIDQLIADWNRNLQEADSIANSFEIVRGESLPSGTPFRLGALLDQNASSLFVFLRQKFGIVYREVFKQWVLPELVKDLKGQDIIALTGNTEMLEELRGIQVEEWYRKNLVAIGPHTQEMANDIKKLKLEELQREDPVIKNTKEIWDGVLPRINYTITGENSNLEDELTTISSLVQLEQDPARRAFLLDVIYSLKNLPKPPEPQPQPEQQPSQLNTQEEPQLTAV